MRFSLLLPTNSKAMRRFPVRLALAILFAAVFLALFAPVLCNEKPFYAKYKGMHLYPALSWNGAVTFANLSTGEPEHLVYSTTDWRSLPLESVLWCPVVYSPGKSDLVKAAYQPPVTVTGEVESGSANPAAWKRMHWLGTTKTGADVFSGMVHGARISLSIGIGSMAIAGLIGILLGASAGFFGDHKLRASRAGLIVSVWIGLPLVYFYGVHLNPFDRGFVWRLAFVLPVATGLPYVAGKWFGRLLNLRSQSSLHIDQLVSRSIEIFNSIPRIVLIITISALSKPSLTNLVLIIGLTSWTEIARLVRAEMLRVRESEYLQSAEASGIKRIRQIAYHALPNVILPSLTAITLGVAAAILTESALSFLGIGVPANVVTWGSLLNEGRQNFNAWWLVAFPGLAIFLTVLAINLLGDALSERIDPKRNS